MTRCFLEALGARELLTCTREQVNLYTYVLMWWVLSGARSIITWSTSVTFVVGASGSFAFIVCDTYLTGNGLLTEMNRACQCQPGYVRLHQVLVQLNFRQFSACTTLSAPSDSSRVVTLAET